MAQFAAFIPYIAAAAGTLLQGASAKGAAKSEAAQLERQAGSDRATSQRLAGERRRSARYAQSRALALAAASGAGASDPTVVKLIGGLEGEGEYGALAALYEGEDRARGLELGARTRRKEGKAAQSASYLSAASTLLGGGHSWFSKYGGGGPAGSVGTSNSFQGTALSDFSNAGILSPRYG